MSAITNTSPIPRPVMRLAALLLALISVILIASTMRDLWIGRSVEIPPGLVERSQQNALPAIEQIYCYDNGQPIYDEMACYVPTATPPAINSNIIEPTPVAGGFRTSNGFTRSKP